MGLVQNHTCCPARVARCFRGRLCPYRKKHGCWFGPGDDLEKVSPFCDVAATSALPLRTGMPVFVGSEAESVVPVKQVTEEIVDFVGQWEKIVDAPVLLRSLDAELGDRVLLVLEQIVEVLKVLPEQQIVVSSVPQLLDSSWRSRVRAKSYSQIVDFPVPQITEAPVDFLLPSPQERVQNCTSDQIVGLLCLRSLRSACSIVRKSRLRIPLCLSSWRHANSHAVPDRSPEQIMDFPVSQNMEAYGGRVRDLPLERVQHHSFVRPKRVFVDFLPLHSASKPYTVKVFTVNLRHHRDDHAYSDNSGFIKGLDKHNMLRFGDVMVPPPPDQQGFLV